MNSDKISVLAQEVLHLSRNMLLVNLRFLDSALNQLELVELDEVLFATDGRYLG